MVYPTAVGPRSSMSGGSKYVETYSGPSPQAVQLEIPGA